MRATSRRLPDTIALAFSVLLVGSLPSLTSCGAGQWSVISPANRPASGNVLKGVAVSPSTGDVWAVGYSTDTTSHVSSTLVERYNGKTWSIVPSDNVAGANNDLDGVAVNPTTGDVWAVGGYNIGTSSQKTLIEHYEGGAFLQVGSPDVPGNNAIIWGVTAVPSTGDMWAVGQYNPPIKSSTRQTLVEQYDPMSGWSIVNSQVVSTDDDSVLNGVAAASANDVWAVGFYDISSGSFLYQTLVEQYTGGSWRRMPSDNAVVNAGQGINNILRGVTVVPSSSDLWAVGDSSTGVSNSRTLIERYDNGTWKNVISPNGGTGLNQLNGVAASANDMWAVGEYTVGAQVHTLIEHCVGIVCTVEPTSNANGLDNFLYGVAVVPSTANVWAVGFSGEGPGSIHKLDVTLVISS
jgi:hypothetical protein